LISSVFINLADENVGKQFMWREIAAASYNGNGKRRARGGV
jgi:hypothetical protein